MSAALSLICLQFGTQWIGLSQIIDIVGQVLREWTVESDRIGTTGVILIQVRLPRVLLGFLVGACLASVGVVLQALLRNPLSRSLCARSVERCGIERRPRHTSGHRRHSGDLFGVTALWICRRDVVVGGGLSHGAFIWPVAHLRPPARGRDSQCHFLGDDHVCDLNYGTQSLFRDDDLADGNADRAVYPALAILACYLLGGLYFLFRQARRLNVLTLGEESARSLGIDTEHVKRVVYVLSALITGAVVSVSGMIGFVGMVIPHAVRFLVGADHRLLLPASACIGGMYLVSADTLARTLLTPAEIPVGIVTALAGGPFFIYS